MGKLKWIATPSTYRFADCEFGRYQIIGRGGRRLRVTDPVGLVLIHPEHRSIADAKAWAEADYARRVASLALANGYVKLQPGECVVNAQYLLSLVDATCKDTCQAYESTQECETSWVELLRRDATAAIDAAGGGK